MVAAHEADRQRIDWNGIAGRNWVEAQDLIDRLFKPIEHLLLDGIPAGSASRVLDVGCGTGGVTLAVQRRLAGAGQCVGVDVSEPMIAAAQAGAERDGTPAAFTCADAQRHAFEPASFDMIISRFGVMFFDDAIEAFTNLRRAGRPGAGLRFAAWRSAAENPFMTAAERAAAPLLPGLPAREPDAPGQFAFADAGRVRGILEKSGWTRIEIEPIDVACRMPERELAHYLTLLGPVGRALHGVDEKTRARVTNAVRRAFDPFVHGDEVRFTAACWMAGARAPCGSPRGAANA